MPAHARVQVKIPRDNGITADIVTNTWYFRHDADSAVDTSNATDLVNALEGFYDDMNSWFSSVLASPIDFFVFDMADTEPRVPVLSEGMVWTPPSAASLPAELAICLSFKAAASSGQNPARRRGRVYLGPLAYAASATSESGGDYRVASAFLSAIDNFYIDMTTAAVADGWTHCVYSPTTHNESSLALSFFEVTTAWVDNAFDIQRRRGSRATSRVTFSPA